MVSRNAAILENSTNSWQSEEMLLDTLDPLFYLWTTKQAVSSHRARTLLQSWLLHDDSIFTNVHALLKLCWGSYP